MRTPDPFFTLNGVTGRLEEDEFLPGGGQMSSSSFDSIETTFADVVLFFLGERGGSDDNGVR